MSFLIDKITNSIEEACTGRSFDTIVLAIDKADLKGILKKNGWRFNWKKELVETSGKIYKIVIARDTKIQGLMCLEPMDGYVEMHLIETAPHNYGQSKQYLGVVGNLVAFACKVSFDLGFDGYVSFTAKTNLIPHYEQSLGAELIFHSRMKIATEAARKLVNSYYKDYFNEGR